MPSDTLDFTAISLLYDDTVIGSKLTEGGSETGDFCCKNEDSGELYYDVGPGDCLSAFRINVEDFPWDNFTAVDMDIELTEVWGSVDDDKDLNIRGVNWNGAPLPSDFSDAYSGFNTYDIELSDNVNSPFPGSPESKTIDLTTLFEYVRDNAPEPLGDITHIMFYGGPPDLTSETDNGSKFDTVAFSVTYPMLADLSSTIDDLTLSMSGQVKIKGVIDTEISMSTLMSGTVKVKGTLDGVLDDITSYLISSYRTATIDANIVDFLTDIQARHTTNGTISANIEDVITSMDYRIARTGTLGVDIQDIFAKLRSVGDAPMELETPFLDPLIYDSFVGDSHDASIHRFT